MPITNTEAVRFANEEVRQTADVLAGAYMRAQAILSKWISKNLSAAFPENGGTVMDGSDTDGRTSITSSDVRKFIEICNDLKDFGETVTVGETTPPALTILKIAVNPR